MTDSDTSSIKTLAIAGVGLLGGSLALACKSRGLVQRVLGVGRNVERLVAAEAAGVIDGVVQQDSDLSEVDLLVVCTPVDRIAADVVHFSRQLPAQATITDVGSTKGAICRAVSDDARADAMFVGSHPIAGSDKQGWEHAQADLFVDRLCLLTPTAGTDASRTQQVARLWRAVGMRTRTCDPDEHDDRLATTSHLPHAIAAALVATLTDAQAPLIGKGFLDTTRIAGGDAAIWTPIFIENSAALLEAIDSFRLHLEDLREAIDDRDAKFLTELLTDAAERRRAIGQRDVAESAERSSDEAGGSR